MIPRSVLGRHDAFYRSRVAQTVRDPQTQVDFTFLADELVHVESSHKVISI
jgi:L-histidine Nalpha-methyltransferase / hercynylcysteine S-oxide synthase